MKESLQGIDKTCVLHESWDSEDGIRSRNILPYNLSFSKGVATLNGSSAYATFTRSFNGVYSVRFRLAALSPSATQYLLDCRANSGTGYIRIDSTTAVSASSGTIYVDGIATSTISTNSKEIVVAGITLVSTLGYIGRINSSGANYLNGSIDLWEIYNTTLSASMVANLKNNAEYKPFLPHGEILGNELVVNGNFSNGGTGWTVAGESTVNTGVGVLYSSTGAFSALYNFGTNKVIGKYYKVIINLVGTTSGQWKIGSTNDEYLFSAPQSGTVIVYITSVETGIIVKRTTPYACNVVISNISVKEVISTANLILDVGCPNGVIRNSLSGGIIGGVTVPAIVNTSVIVVRSGNIWSEKFLSNGSLNCGSYHNLLGDLTVNVFFKANSFGTSNVGKIIDNSKLKIGLNSSNAVINCTSDGSTTVTTASTTVKLGQWMHLAITRKSDGKCSFYINSVLSGSADQNSGTPIAGSTIYIGTTASSNYFDGELPIVQVFSGILSTFEITQLWTSFKGKVNQ